MASIYRRGKTYWLLYRLNGRRVRESAGTQDKGKALVALKAKIGDAARARAAKRLGLDTPDDLTDAKMTLLTLLTRFEEHYLNAGGPDLRESRERSWRADVAGLKHITKFLERRGITKVGRVRSRDIEAFRDWRLTNVARPARPVEPKPSEVAEEPKEPEAPPRRVSGATVNHDIRVGKSAWSWALRAGIVRVNPFVGVQMVKIAQYEPHALSIFQARAVLNAAQGGWLFPILSTALYAGLRLSELIALEWGDVELGDERKPGSIRVRCSETFHTKSRKPRTVPLAPELRAILAPIASTAGLCFPSDAGTRRDPANIVHAVAGLSAKVEIPFSIHDLRRSFASLLAERGVPTTRIRDYLGHASVATTEGYYVARGQVDQNDVAKLSLGVSPTGGEGPIAVPAQEAKRPQKRPQAQKAAG